MNTPPTALKIKYDFLVGKYSQYGGSNSPITLYADHFHRPNKDETEPDFMSFDINQFSLYPFLYDPKQLLNQTLAVELELRPFNSMSDVQRDDYDLNVVEAYYKIVYQQSHNYSVRVLELITPRGFGTFVVIPFPNFHFHVSLKRKELRRYRQALKATSENRTHLYFHINSIALKSSPTP